MRKKLTHVTPEYSVEYTGEVGRMVEEPPAHHHPRRIHQHHALQEYRLDQACRNPGMLDYRIPAIIHFSFNVGQMIKLTANVESSWNSRVQHSRVSASLG